MIRTWSPGFRLSAKGHHSPWDKCKYSFFFFFQKVNSAIGIENYAVMWIR